MPFRARMYIGSSVTSCPSSSHAAGIGRRQADGHIERRGLAGAVRSEQADDLARGDVEVDAADDRASAVRLGEVVRAKGGHRGWSADVRLRRCRPCVCVRVCALPSTDDVIGRLHEGQRPAVRLAARIRRRIFTGVPVTT